MTVLKEPLLYFLVAGTLMFLLPGFMIDDASRRIEVSEAELKEMANQWQARTGRSPTPDELDALVEQWIRGEVYYREALALGLHENDIVIRRRLIRKLQFLEETGAVGEQPTSTELREYYEKRAERYATPVGYTFTHRYFDHARADAEQDALRALENRPEGAAPEGDPFAVQNADTVERWSERDVAQLFGTEFAEALSAMQVGAWQGPVRSGFGWHLVKLEHRHPAERLPFEQVEAEVRADYQRERAREQGEAYFQALRSQYQVVRP